MIRPTTGISSPRGQISTLLNSIRTSIGGDYSKAVGVATETNESIKQIGEQIARYDPTMNSFFNALVNRIAFEIVKNKLYKNPWAVFKQGIMEMGETIEEIFVNIADPHNFDPDTAEKEIFKRVKSDIRSAFHTRNYEKFYKSTMQRTEIKKAFLSIQGVKDLTDKVIESMYTAAAYDEFVVMKFMLCRLALDGKVTPVSIPDIDTDSSGMLEKVKATVNDFQFLSSNWNMSGVMNTSEISDLYVILDTLTDAKLDVEQFAKAFNLEYAEFIGKKVLVDGWEKHDKKRLDMLFKDDPSYVYFTADELTALGKVKAIVLDQNFFMVYDNEIEPGEVWNEEGKYYNYYLHTFKTFSASPFENSALFTTANNSIVSVACVPIALTLGLGSYFRIGTNVETTGFIDSEVTWSISDNVSENTVVDDFGVVFIAADETAETFTVTATSIKDPTKSGTCTITVQ